MKMKTCLALLISLIVVYAKPLQQNLNSKHPINNLEREPEIIERENRQIRILIDPDELGDAESEIIDNTIEERPTPKVNDVGGNRNRRPSNNRGILGGIVSSVLRGSIGRKSFDDAVMRIRRQVEQIVKKMQNSTVKVQLEKLEEEVGGNNSERQESESSEEDEPPGGGDGQGGGILGLLAGLSGGGEGQSDLGSLLATVGGIVANLSGPGFDLNALIASAVGLLGGILAGDGTKNIGAQIGSYLVTALEGVTGGGAMNNGAFLGNLAATVVGGSSAAGNGGSSEEGGGGSDSGTFFISLISSLLGGSSGK